jgi:hypothetical protein
VARGAVLLTLFLAVGLDGCSGASVDGEASGTSVDKTISASSTAATQGPTGQLAPMRLQGTWKLVSIAGKPIGASLIIAISDRKYALRGTDVNGDLVVKENEIDFFNENLCIRGTSRSDPRVGRYQWTLRGRKLHFRLLGKEPCGDRTGLFEDATYQRLG